MALGSREKDLGGEGTKCGGAGVRELAASGRDSGLPRRWGFFCGSERDGVRADPSPRVWHPGKGPLCMKEEARPKRDTRAGPWAKGLAARPQLVLLNCLQMVEYKRAKLRDEESPEITVEGRATRDSLEVGKGVPLFSSGLTFGMMPAYHNHVVWAVLVGHLSRFPLHLWPLSQDYSEASQSHDVAQNRLHLPLCSWALKLTPLAICSMTLETGCTFFISLLSGRTSAILGPCDAAQLLLSCVPQVGFQKRTRQVFGSHTQLELVLAGLILVLAALLLGCLVALWVQYHRGRWVHTVGSPHS